METRTMYLHPVIVGGHIWIGPQVVAEGEMPHDLGRAVLVTMKLDEPAAVKRVRLCVAPPPRQTEFPPPFVARGFYVMPAAA